LEDLLAFALYAAFPRAIAERYFRDYYANSVARSDFQAHSP
jgi:hypothetical protein